MSSFTFLFLSSAYLLIFSLLHTVMASERWKQGLQRQLGRGFAFYRLFYNLFNLCLLAGFYLLFSPYDRVLYRLPSPWHPIAYAIIIASVALVLWVLFVTFDFRDFAGLRFQASPQANQQPLKQDGPFRLCRHPIYLGTFASFLATPHMTLLGAVFTAFVFLYGLFGSIPEERKLAARYGQAYRNYQAKTKRLIPFVL